MDNIIIEDLKIYAHHGVFDFEKKNGQYFYVSAVLYVESDVAGNTDKIQNTVNYAEVCELINDCMRSNTFNLIEAAAEYTSCMILRTFDMVREIELEIKKPDAPVEFVFKNISVRICRKWHRVYLGIGSNMGDRQKYLETVPEAIKNNEDCRLRKVSDFIETEPLTDEDSPVEQGNYLNGCIELDTLLCPYEFLKFVNDIENAAGRTRTIHWGPRTLDVDILLYDNIIMAEDDLVIPHHEMCRREFVLKPLAQIAPYAVYPLTGERIVDIYRKLK